jgi:tRNA pseudouridine38-40 synthase
VERYVRALVEYDGTDYCGFQLQADQPTVQGALESALDRITCTRARVVGAGRTDAGVHALGQVIATRVTWRHDLQDLERAWNAVLPEEIAVREVQFAGAGFHPRFSARRRLYRYSIWPGNARSPLRARWTQWEKQPLNVERMQEAAQYLIGQHDFGAFGQPPQGDNTVRQVFRADWYLGEDSCLHFEIEANAFLRHMVRNIVGSLILVGRGQWAAENVETALASRNRASSGPPAPAQGLCLMAVSYDE